MLQQILPNCSQKPEPGVLFTTHKVQRKDVLGVPVSLRVEVFILWILTCSAIWPTLGDLPRAEHYPSCRDVNQTWFLLFRISS